MQDRKIVQHHHDNSDPYLLTGKLFCLYCGSHLAGSLNIVRPKDKKTGLVKATYRYKKYRCTNAPRGGSSHRFEPGFSTGECKLKMIRKEKLEDFIVNSIEKKFFCKEGLEKLAKLIQASNLAPSETLKTDSAALEKALKKIQAQQKKLLDLYLDGAVEKELYKSKLETLNCQCRALEDELSKARTSIKNISAADLKAAVDLFRGKSAADNLEYRKSLIATFIDHIDISNEEINIYYKVLSRDKKDSQKRHSQKN